MATPETVIVEIVGDTGHLRLFAPPAGVGVGVWAFLTGSFNPSPDERRVVTIFLTNDVGNIGDPTDDNTLRLRFEFTDPLLATVDTLGNAVYLTAEDRIAPYREAKGTSQTQERENL